MEKLKVIDSHTAGEPTRVVVEGWPDLGRGPLAERRRRFDAEFDRYRSAAVNEPRGSDVIVGALLVPPLDPKASAGVIYFNNVGTIGMCGHGTIGLMVTLAHMGRIKPGTHAIETPVDARDTVPLSRVCGRYLDWYELAPGAHAGSAESVEGPTPEEPDSAE